MMEADNSETMTTIEWPFLKSQRDVSNSHGTSSSDDSANHYEIVVSNVDDGTEGLHFANDDSAVGDSNFETCLISNDDLAALTSSAHVTSDGIKLESLKDSHHQDDRVEYGTVQFFSDPDLSGGGSDIIMTEDQQKLIKVYPLDGTGNSSNDSNKLITVYQIKPDDDDDVSVNGGLGGRDVLVEIVSSPEDHLLRGAATLSPDGTLLIGSPDGNDFHTQFSISASMAAAMGLTSSSLAGVSNMSLASPSATTTTTATVAELRCTLCGFVSFSRDEIGQHCEDAHDLFLCQVCNLVFKRRQSLQSHARAKHGTTFVPQRSKASQSGRGGSNAGGAGNSGGSRIGKQKNSPLSSMNSGHHVKVFNPLLTASPVKNSLNSRPLSSSALSPDIMLQLPTQPLQQNMLNHRTLNSSAEEQRNSNNFDLMPEIRDILAKNKAVMPNLMTTSSTSTTTTSPSTFANGQSGSMVSRVKKVTPKGKRATQQQQKNNWARTLSQGDHTLILDSRLSDPMTRNQFNSEFAKKITSHGIGAEMFGMSQDRLPSLRGTYRLDIKEKSPADHPDMAGLNPASASSNSEVMYTYDIVDTGLPTDGCKVICGLCNFSNPRIENVLFHCEIDHKQYYCQNKRCQNGFSSWDSLMRHMKNVHRKDKQ